MKIGILSVGQAPREVLLELAQALPKIFPDTACSVIKEPLRIPADAFVKKRNQFNSSVILNQIRVFAAGNAGFDRVLGVIDVDVFASGLNYVFGEAYMAGKAALISLWRLKPGFYGEAAGFDVFVSRALKEAVHELGHTLGLHHCEKGFCVMHFSNSILDTDKKQTLFCGQDYLQASLAINTLGQHHDRATAN
jgi:archaemetzincin